MKNFFSGKPRESVPNFNALLALHRSDLTFSRPFEILANNLRLTNPDNKLKSLLIASGQPLEGKTTIAVNLGISMMLAQKKVLIIDTDLRKPRLHQMFAVENKFGFSNILAGGKNYQELIQTVESASDEDTSGEAGSLSVITAGRVKPGLFRLFGSKNVKSALDYFQERFSMVILDSPPVLDAEDALSLAGWVHGIVLVLNTGEVTEEDARNIKNRLELSGGKVLGVVMNRFCEKLHGSEPRSHNGYFKSLMQEKA